MHNLPGFYLFSEILLVFEVVEQLQIEGEHRHQQLLSLGPRHVVELTKGEITPENLKLSF